MRMSVLGRQALIEMEGSECIAYRDSAGLPTIGCGHLLTKDELSSGKLLIDSVSVKWKDGLTGSQVEALLAQDIAPVENAVTAAVKVPLHEDQFDALVCFAFNVGTGAFRNSNLLRKLNAGNYAAVPAQLRRWVHAGGEVVAGLANRREKEVALWMA